ncbi:MAG: hypothetical protein IPM92_15890 [Saprospiraceae bacterium]|nr:hypothetical protein [Saprospiraceae bacterium]
MAKNAKLGYSGYISTLLLYFFNTLCLPAQDISDQLINDPAIRKMKSGYILIRLESFDKKIQYIKQSLESEKCNLSCKEKKQKEIKEIEVARDQFNKAFIQAFRKYLSFSKISFYYDKNHQMLKQNQFSGTLFIDDSLLMTTGGPFPMDSLFILAKDKTPESESEGWLFQDSNGNPLRKGFPFITQHNLKTLVNYFSSSDHLKKNCTHMVKKLNKDLFNFYHKAEMKRMEGERVLIEGENRERLD